MDCDIDHNNYRVPFGQKIWANHHMLNNSRHMKSGALFLHLTICVDNGSSFMHIVCLRYQSICHNANFIYQESTWKLELSAAKLRPRSQKQLKIWLWGSTKGYLQIIYTITDCFSACSRLRSKHLPVTVGLSISSSPYPYFICLLLFFISYFYVSQLVYEYYSVLPRQSLNAYSVNRSHTSLLRQLFSMNIFLKTYIGSQESFDVPQSYLVIGS